MPLNATFSTRFSGILKTDDLIEIIYPDQLSLNSKKSSSKASCSAIIAGVAYQPKCTINTLTRSFLFQMISPIKLDFTSYSNGVIIQLVLNNVFVNPESSQPIKIKTKISIKDTNESNIAYYDYTNSSQEIMYAAEAVEITQFQISAKNEFTGAHGRFEVQLTVLEGQTFNKGLKMEL